MVDGLEHDVVFHIIGNVIIPTDFHSIIFQRGREKNTKQQINVRRKPMDFQRANPAAVQRDFVDFPMNSSIHLVCSKGLIAGGYNIFFEK